MRRFLPEDWLPAAQRLSAKTPVSGDLDGHRLSVN